MSLASLASILGGSGIDFSLSRNDAPSLGLDWFALNVLLLAALFVPMERLWPLRPAQSTFRPAWTTDTLYFLTSHLFVQVTTFLILAPAQAVFAALDGQAWREAIAGAATGRPVLRGAALRRPRGVLHPPRVSRDSRALAIPRDSPLEPRHGLARRLATAHRRRGRHARGRRVPALRAGIRSARGRGLPGVRVVSRGVHSRERAVRSAAPRAMDRDAAISSLASRQGPRGHRQELRGAPAVDRSIVRHGIRAGRTMAASDYGIEGDPVPSDILPQTLWPFSRDRG